jgi:hypothetical protein
MLPIEREFDEIFKSKGGRYNNRNSDTTVYDWILTNSRILVAWMVRTNVHLPEPYVDIIDNNETNAYVTKRGDKYFIGITYGAILVFNDIFYRMMESKNVLTEVGDPDREMNTAKVFSIRLTNMGQLAVTEKHSKDSEPIDNIRILFGFQLIKMAFEFLIWHELAHIVFGHVDYIHSVLGAFELKEIEREESRSRLDPIVSQTLEIKADQFATQQSIAIWGMLISNPDALTPALRPYFKTWPMVIKMWIFSTYTFFRLFSDHNYTKGIRNAFHPPPSLRSHLVQAVAGAVIQGAIDAPSAEEISIIRKDAILAVEWAFHEISKKGLDLSHLTFSIQDEAFSHGIFLMNNWEKIKPLLQPFALMELD